MVATVQQLIGKINPKLYAENGAELLKKYKTADKIPAEEIKPKPITTHNVLYDSSSEQLEPLYFWILDFMSDTLGLAPEKFVDNFSSSPGSGHFGEMGQRMSVMQQQGVKILADINTVLRSVLNIIYDLKDFKTRLQVYDDFKGKEKSKSEAARLSLKQIWMDKVDMQRGQGSINALASGNLQFVTLRDAFLSVRDENLKDEKGNTIDLNDRVKRILEARIHEFNIWLEQSDIELRKRYEIEKTYLRSQVNSLKIYSEWAKPYLMATQSLQMTDMSKNPALVKAFNTIVLQLTILGKSKLDVVDEIGKDNFPRELKSMKIKRDYYACVLVDFTFRGIPQKISGGQHYVFGGRTEFQISAYALNKDELDALKKESEKTLVSDVLKLIQGGTTESLGQLQDEINYYLEEKSEEKEEKKNEGGKSFKEVISEAFYPFTAMSGKYDNEPVKEKKKDGKKEEKKSIPEDYVEKTFLRPLAEDKSKDLSFTVYDIYKKAHGMNSFPGL